MNKKYRSFFISVFFLFSTIAPLQGQQNSDEQVTIKNILDTKLVSEGEKNNKEKMIWFKYDAVPLANIVNELATQLNINIMLPTGANALTTKVTFAFAHKIALKKAWQYVITLLKISGFTLVPHVGFSAIVKNDANTNKEPLPLFVNTPTIDLPKTDLKIRYLRYLTNIQVPGGQGGGQNPLQVILKDILSTDSQLIFEPQLNAMVLTDYATNIKSVMEIVDQLDSSTIVQDMKVFRLEYTSADHVKTLFDQLINSGKTQGGGPQAQIPNNSGYFASTTKIIPIKRTNSLVLLGRKDALNRIVHFIKDHIDVPLEEGKSILHVYELKYLKADEFANTLKTIVQSGSNSGGGSRGYGYGSGQSSSSGSGSKTKLFFDGVIIAAESISSGGSSYGGGDGTVQQSAQGGNRLVVAALERDWIRLKKLIIELDQPRMQVAIQGLVVDLSTENINSLASQIRNHSNLFFKDSVHAQAANISSIHPTATNPYNALQSNLLGAKGLSAPSKGHTILSVKDTGTNGIWLITQMLKSSSDAKILSQPYLTTINHKQVNFTSSERRYVLGKTETYQSSGSTINYEPKEASLIVNILPTISEDRIINLGILVNVDEFTTSASTGNAAEGNTNNREIKTNANIRSGDILVIGGLTKTKTIDERRGTPFLEKIPVIKHLFSGKRQTVTKSELMIFLRAEIIDNTQHAMNEFTKYKTDEMMDLLGLAHNKSDNFSQLKDPITHWFFDNEKKITEKTVSLFVENTSSHQNIIGKKSGKRTLPLPQIKPNISLEKTETKIDKTNKAVLTPEEQTAQQELQTLFNWDNQTISKEEQKEREEKEKEIERSKNKLEIIKQKTRTPQEKPVTEVSPEKKKPGPQAHHPVEKEEELKAQKELQALFNRLEPLDALTT